MSNSTVPARGSKVLLTGASGFIAVHVIDSLLAEGLEVVGTVRSSDKGDYLVDRFKGKPFTYVIVEDIGKDNAFDEAVKGVDGIVHTASPFHMAAKSVNELVDPAVHGTVGVLKSAHKNGKDVKRVVITSSVASIMNTNVTDKGKVWTEFDWNEFSPARLEEKKDDSEPFHIYMGSKTLAERAAWKFIDEEKPSFTLATICPPYVLGPIVQQVSGPDAINTSVSTFYPIAKGEVDAKDLPGPLGNYVDVREVADAHAKALVTPKAGGERFIVSAGPFSKADLTKSLNKAVPSLSLPESKPEVAEEAYKKAQVFSGKKATEVLGIQYRSIDDTVKDMYESIKAKGFVGGKETKL